MAATLRQRRWPLVLRPLVFLWWLGHFAFGACAVLLADDINREFESRSAGMIFSLFLAFSYGLAANGYLIFAVGSLTRNLRVLQRVWSARLIVDVALALLGLLLAKMHVSL
jgi:hypothetical protein